MLYGLDLLLMGNYGQRAVETFPAGYALGVLWEVDGIKSPVSAVEQILASGKCPVVRIHLMWKDNHKFTASDIPETVMRARSVAVYVNRYPSVEFYVSPWLENEVDATLAQKVFDAIKAVLPGRTKYVNSGPAKLPGIMKEYHHVEKGQSGKYIYSDDGVTCLDTDTQKRKDNHANAELYFAWCHAFNCKYSEKDKTLRQNRKMKPPAELIESVAMQKFPKGSTFLPAGWIYKAYAEAEAAGQNPSGAIPAVDSWKTVFVAPIKSGTIELKCKGKVIAKYDYAGEYHHDRTKGIFRDLKYRWGLEFYKKAMKLSGKPICNVWHNGKKVGSVNPIFRHGSYRNE